MRRFFGLRSAAAHVVRSGFAGVALCLLAGSDCPVRAEQADPRHPVPSEAEQKQALDLVREVFGDYGKTARLPADKIALAEKMIAHAAQAKSDPASCHALLQAARDLAAAAGDAKTALRAAGETAAAFQVDALETKHDALRQAAAQARTAPQKRGLAEAALGLCDEAVAADRFESAQQVIETAFSAARDSRDKELRARAESLREEIAGLAAASAEYQDAMKTLATSPADGRANRAAGRYLCLTRGQWDKGLSMLAIGADGALRAAAEKDLRRPSGPQEAAALADQWWDLAEQERGPAKKHLQIRAAAWYRFALPSLAGLPKVRAEKRLAGVPYPVPYMYKPGKTMDAARIYGDRKILLIFEHGGEMKAAKAACEKYGLKYDTAKSFDAARSDYSAYHTVLCGSNNMDYWTGERAQPEAFKHVAAFVAGGGHLAVFGSFNCRNTGHLRQFGLSFSFYHNDFFQPVPEKTECLVEGNEDIVPKDHRMRSAGNFTVSVPHTVLLKRGKGSNEGEPALATLRHEKGRVTYTAVEPEWQNDWWLIPCVLSWIARGCPE